MFTGLVEVVGRIKDRDVFEEGVRLEVAAPGFSAKLAKGDSVAVDGVCHTATHVTSETFRIESVRTTLSRTTIGELEPGRKVNLERAIRAGDPLGGHLVQGHVDGVGTVEEVRPAGETVFLRVRLTEDIARITVEFGSLAVDGVSLTVNRLSSGWAELAIIPYTWHHTGLNRLCSGDRVNLEADLIGKYVQRLLAPHLERLKACADEA